MGMLHALASKSKPLVMNRGKGFECIHAQKRERDGKVLLLSPVSSQIFTLLR